MVALLPIFKDGPTGGDGHVDAVMGAVAPFQPGPRRKKRKVAEDQKATTLVGGGGLDVLKMNPNHDERGRFASSGSGSWSASSPNMSQLGQRFKQDGLGLSRGDMPQLSGHPIPGSEADSLPRNDRNKVELNDQFRQYLEASGTKVTDEKVDPDSLKPSQSEFTPETVAAMIPREKEGTLPDNPIWISSDNRILDGHHRWATYVATGRPTMDVHRVDMPGEKLLQVASDFTDSMGIKRQDKDHADVLGPPSDAVLARAQAHYDRFMSDGDADNPRTSMGRVKPDNLGKCYELVGRRVLDSRMGQIAQGRVVHGTIQGGGNPPLGHAWWENANGTIWEPGTSSTYTPEAFQQLFNPVPIKKYTEEGAAANMVRTGHFGPWEDATTIAPFPGSIHADREEWHTPTPMTPQDLNRADGPTPLPLKFTPIPGQTTTDTQQIWPRYTDHHNNDEQPWTAPPSMSHHEDGSPTPVPLRFTPRPGATLTDYRRIEPTYPDHPYDEVNNDAPSKRKIARRFGLLKTAIFDPAQHPRGQPNNAGEFGPGGGSASTPPIHQPLTRVSAPYPTSVGQQKIRDESESGAFEPRMVTTDLIPSDNSKGNGEGKNADSLTKVVDRQIKVPGFEDIDPSNPRLAVDQIETRQAQNLMDLADLSMSLSEKGTVAHSLWYPRANKIITGWANEYKGAFPVPAVIAATAALSPSQDWADNLAWAKKILDTVANQDHLTTEQGPIDALKAAKQASFESAKIKRKGAPNPIPPTNIKAGTKLSDLSDRDLAEYIRGMTEFGGKLHQMGGGPGLGDPTTVARPQTYQFMANAVTVLRHPDQATIDKMLGKELKVRSFYNNLLEPLDEQYQDVTTDTHHFGAANGLPLGMSHPFISSGKESITSNPSIAETGVAGTYPLVVESTRRATKLFNEKYGTKILPNQFQSIVWEMHRSLYPSTMRKSGFIKFVSDHRTAMANGSESREEGKAAIEAERLRIRDIQQKRYKKPEDRARAIKNAAYIPSLEELSQTFDADAAGKMG